MANVTCTLTYDNRVVMSLVGEVDTEAKALAVVLEALIKTIRAAVEGNNQGTMVIDLAKYQTP